MRSGATIRNSGEKPFQSRRRGSAIVEFTLAATFMFVPIMAGLGTVGISVIRGMEVAGVNSSAGQMFSSGVDFTNATNVNILIQVAGNLGLSASGGNGVVILSELEGTSAGAVCTQQIIIGNAGLRSSSYVNPTDVNSSGDVTNLNDPSAQVGSNLPITLSAGQTVYLAETYFNNSLYAFSSAGGTGIYMMNIF